MSSSCRLRQPGNPSKGDYTPVSRPDTGYPRLMIPTKMTSTPWLVVTLMGLCLAGCGGAAKPRATTRSTTTSSQAAEGPTGSSSQSAVTTGPVRATLRGENHSPVVNRNWSYTVTASDASGHPLDGTVLSEFVFAGHVVGRETPPTHPLRNGRFTDILQFPARALGIPLTFQTVVRTRLGRVTLGWPVRVTR